MKALSIIILILTTMAITFITFCNIAAEVFVTIIKSLFNIKEEV